MQRVEICGIDTSELITLSEEEKRELAGGGYAGGNISDLGGYYNELLYFCTQAASNAPIEQATLEDGVASLEFLLRELAF